MARKYSKKASKKVERAMHERKKGTLRSGKGGKGGKVKSRKQAIAIGLSEARKAGAKSTQEEERQAQEAPVRKKAPANSHPMPSHQMMARRALSAALFRHENALA